MRFSKIGLVIAAAGFATSAFAWPVAPSPPQAGATPIQLQCTTASCIDLRTGVYTQSTCDMYGCRPSSGPVGRLGGGPGYGYGYGYGPPRSPVYRGGYRRGGFDCNPSRCIDGSGRLWTSTCDYDGCRPLRPVRGPRW